MQHVMKSSIKSIDEYRHNIKLLKYHLKKEQKINQTLKYKDTKKHKKQNIFQNSKIQNKNQLYSMLELVNNLNHKMKEMGLVLGDMFRMADNQYQGQITKEQFMKTISKLKANVDQNHINQMFYAIDSNMNGMLSSDQYDQFLFAHGGSDSKESLNFQKRTTEKFAALLQKKKMKKEDFINKLLNPAPVAELRQQLKGIGLNINQMMILFKMWDPALTGFIKHQTFLKSMQNVKQKEQRQIKNEAYQKGVRQLCVVFRDRKINPIQIFELSDVDGVQGVSFIQLQESFKKLMPEQTTFQIKKWINLININNDKTISKEQYISAIRSFYSLNNINIFNKQYEDAHPKLRKILAQEDIPADKILHQLSIKIEDQALNKAQLFHRIDINHNGFIDKAQLYQGLKSLGISIGQIGKVLTIFDRDSSDEISLDQWLNILGKDQQMEEVDMPQQSQIKKQTKPTKKQSKKKQTKKPEPKKTQISKQKQISKNEPLKDQDKNKTVNKKNQQKSSLKSSELNKATKANNLGQTKNKSPTKQPVKKQSTKEQPKKPQLTKKQSVKKVEIKKQQKSALKNSTNKKSPVPKKSQVQFEQDKVEQLPQTFSQQQKIVQTQQIQKEIGQIYQKAPKTTLSTFERLCKNKKGMNKSQFSSFLKALKINVSYDQEQVNVLYQENLSQNGMLTKQFFDKLVQTYNLTLQEEKPEKSEKAEKKEKKEKKESKQAQKTAQISKKKKAQEEMVEIDKTLASKVKKAQENMLNIDKTLISQDNNEYQQQFENESQLKKNIEQKITSKTDLKQKRGQSVKQFKQIFDHILKNQTYTQEGYKLSSYINAEDQIKLLKTKYLPLAQSLKKNKKKFEDKDFPNKLQSITHQRPNKSKINNVTLLKWKHYKQFYKHPELFINSIEPNDIKQGALGDCYFLCSLAALAQYKKLIQRLFQYYDIQNGYFLIWLCIDGQWKLVQIDGYFPVSVNDNSKPAFSHSNDEELWVMLLEKAYAKVYGNYERINGGQPYQAIKDLSGCPGQSFTHRSQKIKASDLWQKLVFANKNQFMMTCGTDQDQQNQNRLADRPQPITTQGIVLGHAYSILDIRQYKNQKIIQLRNPWGQTQWNGDWSDSSPKWTEHAKKQLGYLHSADDGIFWMPFQIFFTRYSTTGINYIRPTYIYKCETIKKAKSFLIRIQENVSEQGYIMITQADHRKADLGYDVPYNLTHLLAIQYQNGKVIKQISNQRYKFQREGSVQIINSQKNTQILVFVNIQSLTDIKVCSYTANPIQLHIQENQRDAQQCMIAVAMHEERIKNIQQDKGNFKFWNTQIGQYAFSVFKNVSKKELNLTVEYSGPVNIQLKSKKKQMKMKVGECDLVQGKILNMQQNNFGQMKLQIS